MYFVLNHNSIRMTQKQWVTKHNNCNNLTQWIECGTNQRGEQNKNGFLKLYEDVGFLISWLACNVMVTCVIKVTTLFLQYILWSIPIKGLKHIPEKIWASFYWCFIWCALKLWSVCSSAYPLCSHKPLIMPLITDCNPTDNEFFSVIFHISECWQLRYRRLFKDSVQNCFSCGCFSAFTHSYYYDWGICQPGVSSQKLEIQAVGLQ